MALIEAIAWECRADGDNANGGGFVTGATGTDRSQQAAAHATLTTASVVHTTTTDINVSAGDHTVSAADVGNIIFNTGGSSTAGRYRVVSVDVGNNRWTMDRAVGTAGQTVAGKFGGALLDMITVTNGVWVRGNTVWVRAGTYTRTATTTIGATSANYEASSRGNRVIGYNTTRGDTPTGSNRPLIDLSTNSSLIGLNWTGGAGRLENIRVDCNSLTGSVGIQVNQETHVVNCEVSDFKTYGFRSAASGCLFQDCVATGGQSGATYAFEGANQTEFIRCWAKTNVCPGFKVAVSSRMYRCLATNNTGASSDGALADYFSSVIHCAFHGNGRHGLNYNTQYDIARPIQNNLFTSNGASGTGSGINFTSGVSPAAPHLDFNAYYGNATSPTSGLSDTGGSHASGTAYPLSNVTLSADPYTNAAGDDFTLNNDAGGGADVRGAANTTFLDIGPYQHDPEDDAPPPETPLIVHPGMTGGIRG